MMGIKTPSPSVLSISGIGLGGMVSGWGGYRAPYSANDHCLNETLCVKAVVATADNG